MSNKWIRLDKGHEGGSRIFRSVCVGSVCCSWALPSVVVRTCSVSVGGEHRRPGEREAAPGPDRQQLRAGGEGEERTEEEEAALWSVCPHLPMSASRWQERLCHSVPGCWRVGSVSVFRTVKTYWITRGDSFSTTVTKQETELTAEMIARWVHPRDPCDPTVVSCSTSSVQQWLCEGFWTEDAEKTHTPAHSKGTSPKTRTLS